MLKFFRKKNIAKIIFWGLVILILPPFIFWGTGSIGRSKTEKGPSYVGIINNKKVSFEELFASTTSIRCQIILNYFNQPKVLNELLKNSTLLAKLAWDRLIMLKEAKRYKMKASDRDVVNLIEGHPLFLRNGKFDSKIYEYVLRYNIGLDLRSFEEIIRENLKIQKLNEALTKDIKITDEEVVENYKSDNEKFKISFILIAASSFLDKARISDVEAKDYYEKHKDEFLLPAKKEEGGLEEMPIDIAKFEDVKASIIEFLAENQTRPLARQRAEEEYNRIREFMEKHGDAFEGAASKLGLKISETEFFSKLDYIDGIGEARPLAEAAVKLKKGEMSNPVGVRKGYLIFKVSETQAFDKEKFEKEKAEYSKKTLDKKKNLFLENWLRGLEVKASLNIDLKDFEKYYR